MVVVEVGCELYGRGCLVVVGCGFHGSLITKVFNNLKKVI